MFCQSVGVQSTLLVCAPRRVLVVVGVQSVLCAPRRVPVVVSVQSTLLVCAPRRVPVVVGVPGGAEHGPAVGAVRQEAAGGGRLQPNLPAGHLPGAGVRRAYPGRPAAEGAPG